MLLMSGNHSVSELLIAWGNGEPAALEHLTPRIYHELHKLARAYLRRGRPNQSLQPTALINEAYLRLLDQGQPVQWENRAHFFGIAARLMRLILVDHARTRRAAKRGGDAGPVTLDDCMAVSPGRAPDVLEVDEALERLAQVDERKAKGDRVALLRRDGPGRGSGGAWPHRSDGEAGSASGRSVAAEISRRADCMSGDRWQLVEKIFHGAAELKPEARLAFLHQACGGDESLRREVESLLAHESEDGKTFAGPAEEPPPEFIAHYRIRAKLGEGGMGAVYRATDTKLGREVAIKVLPAAFAGDPELMARLQREAKVLASLNHPNIAAIYGVEDGALVMELVEGQDLQRTLAAHDGAELRRADRECARRRARKRDRAPRFETG